MLPIDKRPNVFDPKFVDRDPPYLGLLWVLGMIVLIAYRQWTKSDSTAPFPAVHEATQLTTEQMQRRIIEDEYRRRGLDR